MVNEQIIKRLQDTMKLYSVVLEQLEELQWLVKDIIEDLEEDLSRDSLSGQKEGFGKPSETENRPTGMAKEGCPT